VKTLPSLIYRGSVTNRTPAARIACFYRAAFHRLACCALPAARWRSLDIIGGIAAA